MRSPDAAAGAARPASPTSGSREIASMQLICLALVLALATLAVRIVTLW
jgi:hypothetical protein